MRKTYALAVVLFAWTMIGADDCVFTQIGKPVPPPPPLPPTKPYCFTDPPLGCAAICTDVDALDFTAACGSVDAGPLTAQFISEVKAAYNSASAKGAQICTALNIGATITPCMDGIKPVEWANQDHEVCTTAPAGCPL